MRHGPGKAAWTDRLETKGVGITGLTTDDQYVSPEHACHATRRDFQANPIHAMVVRKWVEWAQLRSGRANCVPDQGPSG
ncbi:MAG TPA: hypothetical protein VGC99_11150 [Candidatus Tectomicrobia bacterium]